MKKIYLLSMLAIFMVLCSWTSFSQSDKFSVVFEERTSPSEVCFDIEITNLQDSNDDFPLKTILKDTSIDITKATVTLGEWKTRDLEVTKCKSCAITREVCVGIGTNLTECHDVTTMEKNCAECGSYVVIEEESYFKVKSLLSENKDTEMRNQFEEVHIKKGETKKYQLCYSFNEVPQLPNGRWGSYGFVDLDIKGELYNDLTHSSWWNASWGSRRQLNFTGTGTENPTNFTVFVKLDDTRIDYAKTQNAGEDLRFVDQDNSTLSHEITKWNESGDSLVWVKIPLIQNTTEDYMWMYYDNDGASDGQDVNDAWDENYVMASWHCDNTTTTGNVFSDSAGHYNGSMNLVVTDITGQIGEGIELDNFDEDQRITFTSDDTLRLSNISNQENMGHWTAKVWVWENSSGAQGGSYYVDVHEGDDKGIEIITGDVTYIEGWGVKLPGVSSGGRGDSGAMDHQVWFMITITYDTGTFYFYKNDTPDGDHAEAPATPSSSQDIYIGDCSWGATVTCFNGKLDEFVLYNRTLSADEVNTTYKSETDNFITYGEEEEAPAVEDTTAPVVVLNEPSNDTWQLSKTVLFNATPIEDTGSILNCSLWHNESGTFTLEQINTSSITNNTKFGISETFGADGHYLWNMECCDNASTPNCGFNDTNFTAKVDSTAPAWGNNLTNISVTTDTGDVVYFNITFTEVNPDKYIFSLDNSSGSFVNESPINYTSGTQIGLLRNVNVSATFRWKWYANDSAGNIIETDTWSKYPPGETYIVTHNISIVLNITGVTDTGDITSFYHDDDDVYCVSEVIGIPGFSIEMNFSNVTEKIEVYNFHLYAYYDGHTAHYIEIQVMNFSSGNWTKMGEITKTVGFEWYNTSVASQDFISDNVVSVRIYHYTHGDIRHDICFDKFILTEGYKPSLEEIYKPAKCPIDDLPTTLLYIFMGLFLVIIFCIGEWTRVPIFNVITGIGIVFYSLPLWGCYFVFGAIVLIFGIMVIIWSVRWKWT